jgi:hypothetical protein
MSCLFAALTRDIYDVVHKACFICQILVMSNAIKTIDNDMINFIKLHYLSFELTYKTGLMR